MGAAEPISQPLTQTAPTRPTPVLQNIVSTCSAGMPLELKNIAQRARNCEYNPRRFAALIMRVREPKTTALIFASGKLVVTGAKDEESSLRAARKYARIIQQVQPESQRSRVGCRDFHVQNVVASVDVRFPIRLEGLLHAHGMFAHYEPELFPGLVYKHQQPRVTLLIFVSGKVVLTGAKTPKQIHDTFQSMWPVLQQFRKEPAAG